MVRDGPQDREAPLGAAELVALQLAEGGTAKVLSTGGSGPRATGMPPPLPPALTAAAQGPAHCPSAAATAPLSFRGPSGRWGHDAGAHPHGGWRVGIRQWDRECSGETRDQVDVNLYLEKSDRTRGSGAWGGGVSGGLGGRGTTTGRTSSGEGGNRSQVEALRRQGRRGESGKGRGSRSPQPPTCVGRTARMNLVLPPPVT